MRVLQFLHVKYVKNEVFELKYEKDYSKDNKLKMKGILNFAIPSLFFFRMATVFLSALVLSQHRWPASRRAQFSVSHCPSILQI